jgi:phosphatidylglycerol:prolipoprotein diacylglycerol transferase
VTININPVIGKLGSLEFRWYGLIMAVAVLVGAFLFSRQLAKRGIRADHALGIAVIAVPLGIIGARLFHVVDNIGYYWHHASEIFSGPFVGLAIYGVVSGGILGLIIYCRWKKLPILRVLDSTALAFPVGQIIGKFANIINGDTWGYPTKLPWGFTYTNPAAFLPADLHGVPTHPTPVYEQIWLLVMLGILVYLIPRFKTPGMAFLSYVGLYSLGRFFISYYRVNNIIALGLREAQIVALVVLVLLAPAAYFLRRRQQGIPSAESEEPRRAPTNKAKSAGSGAA